MDEVCPGVNDCILLYTIGHDSLKTSGINEDSSVKELTDIRLHMDGLFNLKEHAICFTKEFTSLYTNGPAGGGGIMYVFTFFVIQLCSQLMVIFQLHKVVPNSLSPSLSSLSIYRERKK